MAFFVYVFMYNVEIVIKLELNQYSRFPCLPRRNAIDCVAKVPGITFQK